MVRTTSRERIGSCPTAFNMVSFSELRFYPYLWAVYEALRTLGVSGAVAVMKCAQTGWTETALNLALWFMATKGRGSALHAPY